MCCHDVWTNANLNSSNLLDTDGSPDVIIPSSERMLLSNECLDALLGRPDENKVSDFSEFESVQKLPEISEITFLKLVTLQLVIIRLFAYQRNKL
jgi:hypothetical protein